MKRQYTTPAMVSADVTAEDLIMLSIQIKDPGNNDEDIIIDEEDVWVRKDRDIWADENMW